MTEYELTAIRREVSRLRDGLGKQVDPGIFDTVVAMRALGVNTVGSCEGHSDRVTGSPYILFETPGLQTYNDALDARSDTFSAAYHKARQKIVVKNMQEAQKVITLIDNFYRHEGRTDSFNQQLIVQYFGTMRAALMCQGAYLGHIMSRRERASMLLKNQTVMRAFTTYLLQIEVKSLAPLLQQGEG